MASYQTAVRIEDKIAELKTTYGERVRVEDVGDIVGEIVSTIGGVGSSVGEVAAEIREMIEFIGNAKREISAMRPKSMSEQEIPKATTELDAIVATTEEAAGAIMDAADEIMTISSEVGGEAGDRLMAAATNIFEASSFQDITGQRVGKVVATMKHLEERLGALAAAIGDEHLEEEETEIEWTEDGLLVDDRQVLEGPQLEGDGNSQDDIDALLASFD